MRTAGGVKYGRRGSGVGSGGGCPTVPRLAAARPAALQRPESARLSRGSTNGQTPPRAALPHRRRASPEAAAAGHKSPPAPRPQPGRTPSALTVPRSTPPSIYNQNPCRCRRSRRVARAPARVEPYPGFKQRRSNSRPPRRRNTSPDCCSAPGQPNRRSAPRRAPPPPVGALAARSAVPARRYRRPCNDAAAQL
eukprot:365587-Chlamydomonas_euryale.AAC.6